MQDLDIPARFRNVQPDVILSVSKSVGYRIKTPPFFGDVQLDILVYRNERVDGSVC